LQSSLAGNPACKENIVELSYESVDARVRAIGGTSAEHLRLFVTWLGSQQYSVGYVCIVARHALAFGACSAADYVPRSARPAIGGRV